MLEQDVLWLDVAVDDAPAVRGAEGGGDLPRNAQRIGERQPPFATEAVGEILAFHVPHGVERGAVERDR